MKSYSSKSRYRTKPERLRDFAEELEVEASMAIYTQKEKQEIREAAVGLLRIATTIEEETPLN